MSFKARLFVTLSSISLIVALSSFVKADVKQPFIPATINMSNEAKLVIENAQKQYDRGEQLFKEGKFSEARILFDQAVDELLTASSEVRSEVNVQSYYFELVNKIHLMQFGARTIEVSKNTTPSPLDELSTIDVSKEKVKANEKIETANFDFKFTITPEVYQFINFYTAGRGRTTMEHGLARSGRYRAMAERIFAEEGVPLDLIWLAQVESVWQPSALSWAAAKGIWQFIPSTGHRFGLQQSTWIDERVDPEKATRAAAKYLKFLNNYFAGDWLLAMAAYNSGEGGVDRAIARCGYADFWELHSRNVLPQETRNYVPAILAVIVIAKNHKKYGFNITPEPALKYDTFKLDGQMDLSTVANLLNISSDQLHTLNPALKRGITPPGSFDLKLPVGTQSKFAVAYANLPEDKRSITPEYDRDEEQLAFTRRARYASRRRTSSVHAEFVNYKTRRRAESLSSVSLKYRVSEKELAKHNRLSSNAKLRKGQVIAIPTSKKHIGGPLKIQELARKNRSHKR